MTEEEEKEYARLKAARDKQLGYVRKYREKVKDKLLKIRRQKQLAAAIEKVERLRKEIGE